MGRGRALLLLVLFLLLVVFPDKLALHEYPRHVDPGLAVGSPLDDVDTGLGLEAVGLEQILQRIRGAVRRCVSVGCKWGMRARSARECSASRHEGGTRVTRWQYELSLSLSLWPDLQDVGGEVVNLGPVLSDVEGVGQLVPAFHARRWRR